MLEVHNLEVSYGQIRARRGVSLRVDEGELVTVAGANGAGKTTLLRALSNFTPAQHGRVLFEGRRIDRLPAHRIVELGLAHVPEGRHLFPEMTARENLLLGARPRRARARWRDRLDYVFGLFPKLKERLGQAAGTLSGGEQQMVAIGRGLMSCPRLLLLDEPSIGLAPMLIEQTFGVIRAINRDGDAVLLVEQNVQHALRLSHRGYVLENGELVLTGRGEALLADPALKAAYFGI